MVFAILSHPRRAVASALLFLLAAAPPVPAAPIAVDGGYSATPATSPNYEDTGGTELTDGDVGTLVWPGAAVTPPLVGWQFTDPSITFFFSSTVNIGEITAWLADSDGSAGVGLPESIRVTTNTGFDQTFPVADPPGAGTVVPVTIEGLDLEVTEITLQIWRNTGPNPDPCCLVYEWTMLTEVQFATPLDPSVPSLMAPREIDLGTVFTDPAAVPATLTIGNSDLVSADLVVSGVSFSGPDAARFAPGALPGPVAPGGSGEIPFTFDSGGIPGAYSATLEIASNDPASPAAVEVVVDVRPPDPVPTTAYQLAVVEDEPLLYWTFDEPGETDPAESLVNNSAENRLMPEGGASRTESTTTTGGASLGRAASFDGTPGAMFTAEDLFGDPTPGTNNDSPGFDFIETQLWAVEFWFKVADVSNQYFSETFDGGGNSNNPGLIYNFNPGQVELFGGGGRTGVLDVAPDTWHHVVFAFYGNSGGFADNLREIWLDGVLTESTGDSFSAGHGLRDITIGNSHVGSEPINGAIDEYAIYELGNLPDLAARRARVADIAAHYELADGPGGFRITGIALEPDNRIRLTWTSRPGAVYTIFWTTDPAADFGGDLGDTFDSQGATTTYTVDNPTVTGGDPDGSPVLYLRVGENE